MPASGENEPVNLLACDGGGIRGVSELVILDEIMKTVQRKGNYAKVPKPCDYFHLIGGTSTGGLVAIMLGRLQMTTEDALRAYDNFASDIFSKKRRSLVEKYSAKTLEETIQRLVRDQKQGSLMRDGRPMDAKGRAFVCTMPEQRHRETVKLRTYDISGDKYPNCLIYEAARATTAATTYFRPMAIKNEDGREEKFVDAALGTNNPISILLEEAAELFGKQRTLGCVVSLGTGSRQVEMAPAGGDRLIEKTKFLVSAIKVMKEIGTDSEKDHERMKVKFGEFEDTYFRLNVDGGAQGIELSDWKKIGELKERTRTYLQKPEIKKYIEALADVLLHNRSQGLTLAHGGGLSKELTIPVQPRFIRRGKSSNIFTGRQKILERMDNYFRTRVAGDNGRRREFQLRGMGGVGKTQIALKFTERNDRKFHILWVDATDDVTTQQSFRDIANNIFGPADRPKAVEEVLRWLYRLEEEWLLVFDNTPNTGMTKYLPDGDRGNVLYTTRHRNLQPRLRPECIATIEEMEIQDAVRLLLWSAQMPDDIEKNRELAKAIVRELGFLPLAIDQAGAYIHMAPCPIENYLDVFNTQKDVLLRNPKFKGGDTARHIAVYATFNISYQAIKAYADKKADMERVEDAISALKVLALICFFHNEGRLPDVFDRAAQVRHQTNRYIHFPLRAGNVDLEDLISTYECEVNTLNPKGRAWDGDNFVSGIRFLNEFSLIKIDESTAYTNMHILVHEWARNRMSKSERLEWALAARSLLLDSETRDKRQLLAIAHRRIILPHLEACLKYANVEHSDPKLESEYQGSMAEIFQQAGQLDAAEVVMAKALIYRKREFGLLHPATFAAVSQMARLYLDKGCPNKAEELLLENLDRRRLYQEELRWEKAQEAAKKREAKLESASLSHLAPEDPLDDLKIRKDTECLALALTMQDNVAAADKYLAPLISWLEKNVGPDHHLRHASSRLCSADKYQVVRESGQFYEKVRDQCGLNHPATIVAKHSLAAQLVKVQAFHDATIFLFDVFHWNSELYGREAVVTLEIVTELGDVLMQQHRAYEALGYFHRALKGFREALGDLHPTTLMGMHHLALCFYEIAQFEEAITLMDECFKGRLATLGSENRLTAYSELCVQQFREIEVTAPDYVRAMWRNRAMQASLDTERDEMTSQWARENLVPEDVEGMMQAHSERGEQLYETERLKNGFYKLVPIGERKESQRVEIMVQGGIDGLGLNLQQLMVD